MDGHLPPPGTGKRGPDKGPRLPRHAKEILRSLIAGEIELQDGRTGGQIFAEVMLEGMQAIMPLRNSDGTVLRDEKGEPIMLPDTRMRRYYLHIFGRFGLEFVDKMEVRESKGSGRHKNGMSMVFMHEVKDPLALPGSPAKPLRLLGQIASEDGTIIDAKTGEPVGMPRQSAPREAATPRAAPAAGSRVSGADRPATAPAPPRDYLASEGLEVVLEPEAPDVEAPAE